MIYPTKTLIKEFPYYCKKNFQVRSYFWPVFEQFSRIILCIKYCFIQSINYVTVAVKLAARLSQNVLLTNNKITNKKNNLPNVIAILKSK